MCHVVANLCISCKPLQGHHILHRHQRLHEAPGVKYFYSQQTLIYRPLPPPALLWASRHISTSCTETVPGPRVALRGSVRNFRRGTPLRLPATRAVRNSARSRGARWQWPWRGAETVCPEAAAGLSLVALDVADSVALRARAAGLERHRTSRPHALYIPLPHRGRV